MGKKTFSEAFSLSNEFLFFPPYSLACQSDTYIVAFHFLIADFSAIWTYLFTFVLVAYIFFFLFDEIACLCFDGPFLLLFCLLFVENEKMIITQSY